MNTDLTILTGASRGLGQALAAQLLVPGASVICISRHENAALAARAAQSGASLEQWTQDLRDGEHAALALSRWLNAQSPSRWTTATLINNAGVIPALVPLRQAQPADLALAMRVGLEAPLLLCAAFLGATGGWSARRKVLNISSGLGRRAMASSSAYCAAKAGMDHFTRCMALEEALISNGAKVCSLAPGVIDTDMQVQLREADVSQFPDLATFTGLHAQGLLSSPALAAARVLAHLNHPDFGTSVVADVRG